MSSTRLAVKAIQISATLARLMAISTQIMELPIQSTRTPPSGSWSREMKNAVAKDGPADAGAAVAAAASVAAMAVVRWFMVRSMRKAGRRSALAFIMGSWCLQAAPGRV